MQSPIYSSHYTVVEDNVIDDEQLSAYGLLCYMAIRRHVNADGVAWPSRARLAKVMRCSARRVDGALDELIKAGYLEVASGQGDGRPNVYTLMNYRYERGGAQEVPRGAQEVPRGGAQEVRTEVSSDKEVASLKNIPSPSAPVGDKKRDGNWKAAAELVRKRGGPWASGVKEAVSMDRLVAWAKQGHDGAWPKFLMDFLDGAWALRHNEVFGLKQRDADFWASQPYTPSSLLCHASRIVAVLEQINDANTVDPEIMALATADLRRKHR